MRKQLIALLFALLAPALAAAQSYPSKTVRLISGVTPGSVTDTMARILAEKLPASLGQPVIVENRLGAGGIVAAASVANGYFHPTS
jgi:tripartite-type tricarboxylate transporter receptor subunit TctC